MAGLKRRIHVGKGLPFFIFLKSAVCGAWRIIRVIPKKDLSRYLRKSLQIQAVLKNISG